MVMTMALPAEAPIPLAPRRRAIDCDEDVGVEMRRLREEAGLTQMDVAILCQVDISTISRWERGLHQYQRSKHRQIRQCLEALKWAAEQEHSLTREDLQNYARRRWRGR